MGGEYLQKMTKSLPQRLLHQLAPIVGNHILPIMVVAFLCCCCCCCCGWGGGIPRRTWGLLGWGIVWLQVEVQVCGGEKGADRLRKLDYTRNFLPSPQSTTGQQWSHHTHWIIYCPAIMQYSTNVRATPHGI